MDDEKNIQDEGGYEDTRRIYDDNYDSPKTVKEKPMPLEIQKFT